MEDKNPCGDCVLKFDNEKAKLSGEMNAILEQEAKNVRYIQELEQKVSALEKEKAVLQAEKDQCRMVVEDTKRQMIEMEKEKAELVDKVKVLQAEKALLVLKCRNLEALAKIEGGSK